MASVLPDASERKHGGIFLLHKHKREAGTQEALTPADTELLRGSFVPAD